MLCCEENVGVSVSVLLESSEVVGVCDWGMLKWTLGVWNFLFLLGCMICLFISSVFWFWLICLTRLRSCCQVGSKLYVCSLKGAWRWTGSKGSDNRACRSSKVYGLSWKEIRVDGGGLLVVVGVIGLSWDLVGRGWFGGGWLAILKSYLSA